MLAALGRIRGRSAAPILLPESDMAWDWPVSLNMTSLEGAWRTAVMPLSWKLWSFRLVLVVLRQPFHPLRVSWLGRAYVALEVTRVSPGDLGAPDRVMEGIVPNA